MVENVHKFCSHCPSVCFGSKKEEKSMRVKEKNLSYLQNTFFLFSSIWTPPTFKAHNFFISSSFKMI
jgi:hypothetical protein